MEGSCVGMNQEVVESWQAVVLQLGLFGMELTTLHFNKEAAYEMLQTVTEWRYLCA